MRFWLGLCFLGIAMFGYGCADHVGDSCDSSSDCSDTGTRICDTSQPGGYCTVFGCDPDTCPGGSRCVEWRFEKERTSATWCMRTCGGNGDCRTESGYACVRPDDIEVDGEPVARFIDLDSGIETAKICAAVNAE